jgi:hypothetical protein
VAELITSDKNPIDIGLTNDGRLAITKSPDGTMQFWNALDGKFSLESTSSGVHSNIAAEPHATTNHNLPPQSMSTDLDGKVISWRVELVKDRAGLKKFESKGPIDICDTTTEAITARLSTTSANHSTRRVSKNDKWIAVASGKSEISIYYSSTGNLACQVAVPNSDPRALTWNFTSDDKYFVATAYGAGGKIELYWWETDQWKLVTTLSAGDSLSFAELEDRFSLQDTYFIYETYRWDNSGRWMTKFRPTVPAPLSLVDFRLQGRITGIHGNQILLDSGQVVDLASWRSSQPPRGKRWHPILAQLSPDHSLVALLSWLVDTQADRAIPTSGWRHSEVIGWHNVIPGVTIDDKCFEINVRILPTHSNVTINANLISLWTQVAVRGELDEQDNFVPWDEPTWEAHRQQLAAATPPYPNIPFPGYLATDRLHWLRQEYEQANEAEKPTLARWLLERAEALGDLAEADRWRAIVSPPAEETKEEAPATNPPATDAVAEPKEGATIEALDR